MDSAKFNAGVGKYKPEAQARGFAVTYSLACASGLHPIQCGAVQLGLTSAEPPVNVWGLAALDPSHPLKHRFGANPTLAGSMNLPDNAYQTPSTIDPPKKTRGTAWALWAGAGCLLVSFVCVSLVLTGMASSFSAVAEAPSGARPEELASGVNNALVWIMWAIPLGILGIALVTVGFVVRRPV